MCTKSFFALNPRKSLKMSTFSRTSVGALFESQKMRTFYSKEIYFLAEGFVFCLFVMFHPSELSAGDAKRNIDKTAKHTHLNCNKV